METCYNTKTKTTKHHTKALTVQTLAFILKILRVKLKNRSSNVSLVKWEE